jgi:hypothetical protein
VANKNTLFKPSRIESRATVTDMAAREIILSELASRREKTERLKAARLAKEAVDKAAPPPPPPAKKSKRK